MRTSFDLPDDLYAAIKAKAAVSRTTVREIVIGYLQDGLAGRSAPSAPVEDVPFPVLSELADGPALPALSNAELFELLDADDAQ